MIFGSRQERFIPVQANPSQLSLDIHADEVASCSIASAQKISYTRTEVAVEQKPVHHPGRMKLPEHLRREAIIIEPCEDITGCKKMGEEITEILDYIPGELYVKQYRRPKYVRPDNSGIVIGELPVRAIDKCMAAEGLLAQVIIDKYLDHLPVYRQMQRFERAGVKIPYATLTTWIAQTCQLITPLFEALKKEVLDTPYLQIDETPIKVLDKGKAGTTHKGFYWVYHDPLKKMVFFDYQEGRSREGPVKMLRGFRGYIQSDGYNAYEVFDNRKDITLLHCLAHARRMFIEAMDNDRSVADYVLVEIQRLYTIERRCRENNLSHDQIHAVRQAESVPILSSLGIWMKQRYMDVPPKSSTGKALAYSIGRWEKLSRYTENGDAAN